MVITRHDEAVAVLSDPRYVPPPVRRGAAPYTLGWLRERVSRFSSGQVHAERRRTLAERLAAIDPAALRRAARDATVARGGSWEGVPTAVLGAALGASVPVPLVEAVAAGYLSGEESPDADAAVTSLLSLLTGDRLSAGHHTTDHPVTCVLGAGRLSAEDAGQDHGGGDGDVGNGDVGNGDFGDAVAVLTLLLQAHAATEGLIRNALAHASAGNRATGHPGGDHRHQESASGPTDRGVDGLLHETLRHDPPLQVTRRIDRVTGDEVVIDLVAANRDPGVFADPGRFDGSRGPTPHLTFGAGVRPCPGSAHAFALAAGVLDARLGAGADTAGLDAAGIDATRIDAAGIDATGIGGSESMRPGSVRSGSRDR
ncbi:cytochrome P450 [Nonomuraea cavernae]|nr:cytochrome P450 [Nonomuraea cavernae]MCA2190520.1 cytochrome P450 [Nonomuraea cavernae]